MKRDERPWDKKTKGEIASDIVKKKGDTSKSDDRYAYEEVQLEAKVDEDKWVSLKETLTKINAKITAIVLKIITSLCLSAY